MPRFIPNDEFTYIESEHVKKNPFIGRAADKSPLPIWEQSRHLLPEPFLEGGEDIIACHSKAWQLAFASLRQPKEESGFVSPFIDTAFNDCLFMWDSSFILMFGRYGSRAFNFQRTLDNLYARQHKDGFICREICENFPGEHFARNDPSSTGPGIMAWCEWEYFKTTSDIVRLEDVYYPLLAYHNWMRENRTWRDGTYWSTGWGCGMDNQPRLEPGRDVRFSHGHMIWADTCMQAVLDARTLAKMARVLGHAEDIPALEEEADRLTAVINDTLWDDEDAFYYDMWSNGKLSGVKTIGAYWALLADIVPPERVDRFIAHLENEKEFNRPHRVPTLSADHPEYNHTGGYWRGGVWAPTTYMLLKGLSTIGKDELAHKIALNHLKCVTDVFCQTGTLWENYSPEHMTPGTPAKPDFVGWTGLSPISIFYEFVLGIKSDPIGRVIEWDVRLTQPHGIRRYPFGDIAVDIICAGRRSPEDFPQITIISDKPIMARVRCGSIEREVYSQPR